jgi:hypothetical protein
LDLTNSRLVVDQQLFTYAVSNNNLPPAVLPRFVAAAQTVVDGGVAAFSDGNNVVNGAAVIPWSVLGEHITWRGGATLPIQQALGIVGATDGDDAAQRIRQKFPQSPEWLLTDPFRRRLIIDPLGLPTSHPGILLPGGGSGIDPDVDDLPPVPPPTSPVPGVIVETIVDLVQQARQVGGCLLNGQWDGLGGHWWGWVFGWEVAMGEECGNQMANLLNIAGGAEALERVVQVITTARTISDALKVLGSLNTPGAALAAYAGALAWLIRQLNGPRGIVIQGNWPVIGGPGAFVWAIPGR